MAKLPKKLLIPLPVTIWLHKSTAISPNFTYENRVGMGGLNAILLLAAGFGIWFFTQARAGGNLLFFPGNITGISLSGINPIAQVELLIQNTSNVQFEIRSLAANATSNNTLIGNVANFTPVIVPANSQVVYALTIRFLTLSLLDDIINAINTGSIRREIKISGTANANGQQVPIDITYVIGG